ncbi:hypothetical protein UlMin_015610 [Ulmus minor]
MFIKVFKVVTGKEVSPVVSQSICDYPKPIIGPNGVAVAKEIDGEGGGSLEVNWIGFLFFCPKKKKRKENRKKKIEILELGCCVCILSAGLMWCDDISPHFPFNGSAQTYKLLKHESSTRTLGLLNQGVDFLWLIIDEEDVEIFVRQVRSSSRVRHPKLVALFGCCVKEDQCFVVYELCPNRKLSEWLFVLSIQRLEIAIDSTRGLCFLHTYPEGYIVHRDIKPTNILLGENFEAKPSDFEFSKVIGLGETFVSSEVRGTFGYVDPDYLDNWHVKSAGDVYSFGIILVQIISGKKFVFFFLKDLKKEGYQHELDQPMSLNKMLALSYTALKRQRPSIEQIVEKLEEALDISKKIKAYTPKRSSILKQTNA